MQNLTLSVSFFAFLLYQSSSPFELTYCYLIIMHVYMCMSVCMCTDISGRTVNWWADQGEVVNVEHGKNKDKSTLSFSNYDTSGFKNLPCIP